MRYFKTPYTTPPFRAVTGTSYVIEHTLPDGQRYRAVFTDLHRHPRSRHELAAELLRMRRSVRRAVADIAAQANLIACDSGRCGVCYLCADRDVTRRLYISKKVLI